MTVSGEIRRVWRRTSRFIDARLTHKRNRDEFLKQMRSTGDGHFQFGPDYPCLHDRYHQAGSASGGYFFQDLVVARKIYEKMPDVHFDVASRIDGFVTHVAVFTKVHVIDIRPLQCSDKNITFVQGDIFDPNTLKPNSISSLSCLHALEHFGLGRYGDPVDYNGHVRGFSALARSLTQGGTLYFSVPLGKVQRVEFDGHRIFSLPYLKSMFDAHSLTIADFCYVDDKGQLVEDCRPNGQDADNSFNLRFGLGVFELTSK